MRRGVDRAFDEIRSFRPSRTTIGINRDRVRIDRAQPHMRSRDIVGAGRHADTEPRNKGCVARQVGPHVGDNVEL